MHLVMFDIDGTLTESKAIDADCFVQAISEVLQLPAIDRDWSRYRHVTDSGIATEIIETNFGRPPLADELERIAQHFVALLSEKLAASPELCRPIGGAAEMLAGLSARNDVAVALATGGWSQSARLKLGFAGLNIDGAAFASADDSIERAQIMLIAKRRAIELHQISDFDSFVYVGDGFWDFQASRALSISFIGIANGDQAGKLNAQGAELLLPDFCDQRRFLKMLHCAQTAAW
jgi:phosphoglycolate phosphatase-like HAD superfamily hydrolase